MKKIRSFCTSVILIISVLSLSAQEVNISIDHPAMVNAGEVFEVTVTISKGALSDYSRFSQDLPLGLTATNVHSPNADFSFDNQRIRIIWLKLPDSPEINVKYNIMVDEHLKGKFALTGVFAYVVDEERKFLNLENTGEITIVPSSSVDPALIVDIKDYKGEPTGAPVVASNENAPFAMAIRQKPVLLSTGGYYVKLLVQNPRGSKYAKVEEVIPSGYLFESVDPHNGIESFSSSTVKFIWMKLPAEPEFEVSYRLVPKREEPQGPMTIKGELTYSVGNENRIVEIKQLDVDLESLSVADKRNLLLTGSVSSGVVQKTPVVQDVPEPVPTRTEPEAPVITEQVIANTPVLQPQPGVYFRVQIAAIKNAEDASTLFREAGIVRDVFVEVDGGYYKYTAGTFTDYNQAVSYRDQVDLLPEVEGAFVVAYRDGKRIPISSLIAQ